MDPAAQIILATAIAGAIGLWMRVYAKKNGLDIAERQEARLERVAREGAFIARVQAVKSEALPGPNLTIADENRIAINHVLEVAKKERLPTPSHEKLEAVVLPAARASYLPPKEAIAEAIGDAVLPPPAPMPVFEHRERITPVEGLKGPK